MLGGGVSHPSQLTTGLVIKSVTTSPTLAGERMLFILQVSILSEQTLCSKFTSTNTLSSQMERVSQPCQMVFRFPDTFRHSTIKITIYFIVFACVIHKT